MKKIILILSMLSVALVHAQDQNIEKRASSDINGESVEYRVFLQPRAKPLVAKNGKLYGIADSGRLFPSGKGRFYTVLYEYDPETDDYVALLDFDYESSGMPFANLVEGADGKIYGMLEKYLTEEDDPEICAKFKYTIHGIPDRYLPKSLFEFDVSNNKFSKVYTIDTIFPYEKDIKVNKQLVYYDSTIYCISETKSIWFKYNCKTDKVNAIETGNKPEKALLNAGYWVKDEKEKFYFITAYTFYINKIVGHHLVKKDINLYGNLEAKFSKYKGREEYDWYYKDTSNKVLVYFSDDSIGYNPAMNLAYFENKVYGIAYTKYNKANGFLFSYDTKTEKYSKEFEFEDEISGLFPIDGFTKTNDNIVYGVCSSGGIYGKGVLYKYDLKKKQYTKLVDFKHQSPSSGLSLANQGKLYGVTQSTLYEYDIKKNLFTIKLKSGKVKSKNK